MATVDEEVVGFLLPYIVAGLRGGVVGGYRDATCMVVGGLSGSVVMRRELVDGTFSCIGVLAAASARRLWIVVGAAAPLVWVALGL